MRHRKYDKPWYRRWPGKWPFKYVWYIWNPFKVVDKRHMIIADIFMRKRGRKLSEQIRAERKRRNEGTKKWFSCKLTRSVDFSGGSG